MIQSALLVAVQTAYEADSVLLADQTHERAILFHVGRHLASAVDKWAGPWTVDVEYNRLHDGTLEVVAKKLYETPWHDGGLVIPDLIVHDRTESSSSANLLVVEAKRDPSHRERAADCAKLAAYLQVLEYQLGVYLELSSSCTPKWEWFHTPAEASAFADDAMNGQTPRPMW